MNSTSPGIPSLFLAQFRTPDQQRQLKFDSLPEWIHKEYLSNGTIHAIVSRWLYTEHLSHQEFLEKLAELEHKRAEFWQEYALQMARLHGMPPPTFIAANTPNE